MEDLRKLMNDVTEKVQEVQGLREDRDNKQKELVKTMQENYNKLFKPDVVALIEFINTIWNNNIHWESGVDYYGWIDDDGKVQFEVVSHNKYSSVDKGHFYVKINRDSVSFDARFGVEGVDSNLVVNGIGRWTTSTCYTNYQDGFVPFFGTEEGTIKCVSVYQRMFSEILQKILENCDVRIGNLKDSIENLKNRLSSASTIIENADGSIELTLNGKTYIGTVKEK